MFEYTNSLILRKRAELSPPRGKLHRTVPYCMAIDQRYGHRPFDRIQKQPPAREASHHLRMNRRNHRAQARVRKLA